MCIYIYIVYICVQSFSFSLTAWARTPLHTWYTHMYCVYACTCAFCIYVYECRYVYRFSDSVWRRERSVCTRGIQICIVYTCTFVYMHAHMYFVYMCMYIYSAYMYTDCLIQFDGVSSNSTKRVVYILYMCALVYIHAHVHGVYICTYVLCIHVYRVSHSLWRCEKATVRVVSAHIFYMYVQLCICMHMCIMYIYAYIHWVYMCTEGGRLHVCVCVLTHSCVWCNSHFNSA